MDTNARKRKEREMKKIVVVCLFILGGLVMTYAAEPLPTLETVPKVDLTRYTGLWYEFARFPNRFEDPECTNVTAEYTLRPDGKITVVNSCFLRAKNKQKRVKGKAWVVDPSTNAKLKVSFFWPFSGKYWIIGLADDYSWALVGEPERKYFWILTRSTVLEKPVLDKIGEIMKAKGFDPNRLIFPDHEVKIN